MQTDASWLTTTNLILIAIGVVLALIVIVHGARLKRRRRAVDAAIEDRADDAPPTAPTAARTAALDETPPAPETLPPPPPPVPDRASPPTEAAAPTPEAAAAPTAMPAAPTPPPVAPAPPPLAGDDTPVVATAAPFDPAPATIAADLATPPADPAPIASENDDLTRLKGVGPKLATRLNELGIATYAQIAALSPAEAEALDRQLGSFQGRMTRDRWIEQAGYLASDNRAGFEAAFGKL